MDQKELDKFKCDGLLPSERVRNAAPALLEALDNLLEEFWMHYSKEDEVFLAMDTVIKAKAAIKQARGGVMNKDQIITALVDYAGPLDDPRIGYLGRKPSTNDHFQCERCGEESLDCWEIPHKEGCTAKALLDQLKTIKDWVS